MKKQTWKIVTNKWWDWAVACTRCNNLITIISPGLYRCDECHYNYTPGECRKIHFINGMSLL